MQDLKHSKKKKREIELLKGENKQQILFVPCYIRNTLLQVLQVFTFVVSLKKDKLKEKMCSYGVGRVVISFWTHKVITQLPFMGNKWSLYQVEGQELCPQVITTKLGTWLRVGDPNWATWILFHELCRWAVEKASWWLEVSLEAKPPTSLTVIPYWGEGKGSRKKHYIP